MSHLYTKPPADLLVRRRLEYQRDFIDRWLPAQKTARILDLGCGYGMFLHACAQSGYQNLTGVEQESDIATYAQTKFRLSNIVADDLLHFISTQPDQSYDVIVAFNIIEHLQRQVVMDTLKEIQRLLTNGGTFIVEVPNGDSPLGIHTLYSDITHHGAFTKLLLEELLIKARFQSPIIYPRFINSNPLIRLGQKILAKIVGLDDKLMFSGNIVAVAKK